jgi:N-ethylmaleimide reductase
MKLFSPVRIGAIETANRVFMAPLTRCRATPGTDAPNQLIADYYAQRSSAGLIVSEATQVLPEGKGYMGTPGIYSSEQEAGWKIVTQAVHRAGGKIVAQLWHVGAVSHPDLQPNGALPFAILPINARTNMAVVLITAYGLPWRSWTKPLPSGEQIG